MKQICFGVVFVFTLCFAFQCQSPASRANKLSGFVEEFLSTEGEKMNVNTPIETIREAAIVQADKTIRLTQTNIVESLKEARGYQHALIIVGKHTLVKITDFDKTQKSTSWACEMPYGKGYIQNDGLKSQSDYINKIIGTPDKQVRWLFLFKKKA